MSWRDVSSQGLQLLSCSCTAVSAAALCPLTQLDGPGGRQFLTTERERLPVLVTSFFMAVSKCLTRSGLRKRVIVWLLVRCAARPGGKVWQQKCEVLAHIWVG